MNDLQLNLSIDLDNLSAAARAGFLEVGVQNGSIHIDAGLRARMQQGQSVTAGGDGSTAPVFEIAYSRVNADGRLPITASFGSFNVPAGSAAIDLRMVDLFSEMIFTPNAAYESAFSPFEVLDAQTVISGVKQLSTWLHSLKAASALSQDLPFMEGISIGDQADLGDAIAQKLLAPLNRVAFESSRPAPSNGRLNADVALQLVINGETELPLLLAAANTSSNTQVSDLANDLQSALSNALAQNGYQTTLEVRAKADGRLSISGDGEQFQSIRLEGGQLLGFDPVQKADGLRFASVQQLVAVLAEILGVSVSDIGAKYDAVAKTLTFRIGSLRHSVTIDETPLKFDVDLKGLAGITSEAKLSLEAEATGGFTLGFLLEPPGKSFRLSLDNPATPLNQLNHGKGVSLESGDANGDVLFTLSSGQSFRFKWGQIATIADVKAAIERGTSDQVLVEVDEATDALWLVDRAAQQSPQTGFPSTFTVTAIGNSPTAFDLGIIGVDDDGDGIIRGRSLHGQTVADQLFLSDAQFSVAIHGVANKVQAEAQFGPVEVGIRDGSALVRATSKFALRDPGTGAQNDGRFFLRELLGVQVNKQQNGLDQLLQNVTAGGSANLTLPIFLRSPVPGLSLPENARIIASWSDITNADTLRIVTENLGSLSGMQWMTSGGLREDTPLSQLNQVAESTSSVTRPICASTFTMVVRSTSTWLAHKRSETFSSRFAQLATPNRPRRVSLPPSMTRARA